MIPRQTSLVGAWLCCGLLVCSSGCELMEAGRQVTKAGIRQFTPKTNDYSDNVNFGDDYESDEWGFVGQEGRGDTAREKESDGLTKWVSSPKARAIEKNLGYD